MGQRSYLIQSQTAELGETLCVTLHDIKKSFESREFSHSCDVRMTVPLLMRTCSGRPRSLNLRTKSLTDRKDATSKNSKSTVNTQIHTQTSPPLMCKETQEIIQFRFHFSIDFFTLLQSSCTENTEWNKQTLNIYSKKTITIEIVWIDWIIEYRTHDDFWWRCEESLYCCLPAAQWECDACLCCTIKYAQTHFTSKQYMK